MPRSPTHGEVNGSAREHLYCLKGAVTGTAADAIVAEGKDAVQSQYAVIRISTALIFFEGRRHRWLWQAGPFKNDESSMYKGCSRLSGRSPPLS